MKEIKLGKIWLLGGVAALGRSRLRGASIPLVRLRQKGKRSDYDYWRLGPDREAEAKRRTLRVVLCQPTWPRWETFGLLTIYEDGVPATTSITEYASQAAAISVSVSLRGARRVGVPATLGQEAVRGHEFTSCVVSQ
jgi:hypothetical protein